MAFVPQPFWFNVIAHAGGRADTYLARIPPGHYAAASPELYVAAARNCALLAEPRPVRRASRPAAYRNPVYRITDDEKHTAAEKKLLLIDLLDKQKPVLKDARSVAKKKTRDNRYKKEKREVSKKKKAGRAADAAGTPHVKQKPPSPGEIKATTRLAAVTALTIRAAAAAGTLS